MSLLDIYKERNSNPEWLREYSSLAKGMAGRMFEYTNTNFRTQNSFFKQFSEFLEIENKERGQWVRQSNHGQEEDKHRVVNLIQSKLFKRDVSGISSRTAKGILYTNFIDSAFQDKERWILNYLFLLNGYYANRKNYLIYRVKEDLLGYLLSVDGVTKDLLIEEAKKLLAVGEESLSRILRNHFFFLHSFYRDSDFLTNYLRSPESEKEELASYIQNNIETENYICCISKKYHSGGNFTRSSLLDETKVFLLTLLFIQSKGVNPANFYEIFVENYNLNISEIDKKTVLDYIHANESVFGPICEDVLELEEIETEEEPSEVEISDVSIVDKAEDYIDETSEAGKLEIKAIFSLRKKQARIQSGYTCALETINNCKPIYFTAKANDKNYLELHHFIPREFRNDFSYSIEVLANYVTLCPRCHRQIHLAVDRERKYLINALYSDRCDRLKVVGLEIDQKKIYEYYKITD